MPRRNDHIDFAYKMTFCTAKDHAAQVSEPRTNSQYHPQHVPGLGEQQKIMGRHPIGTLIPVDPIISAKLTVRQKSAFSHNPFAFNALRHDDRPQ
jgi:hypothetical protein